MKVFVSEEMQSDALQVCFIIIDHNLGGLADEWTSVSWKKLNYRGLLKFNGFFF